MLKLFYKHKIIINNFFHFTLLRAFNIVTKFLLVAYLVRILGENTYGLLTWSESILQYFIIIINFGFNIYGAKYIIKYKDQKPHLDNIISSIYIIKSFFLLISFLTLFLIFSSNVLNANYNILFLLLISAVGDMLFPIWYFQGIQKLDSITKIVAISKFLLLLGVFIFVKSSQDLYVYIYLFSGCQILMGILGFFLLRKHSSFSFIVPNIKTIKKIFSKAKLYFLGNLSMLVFNALTIFLIGVYVSLEKVTGFDISLKIVLFTLLPFEILQATFLPEITKNQNINQLKKLAYLSFLTGVIIFICLNLFSEGLLNLFGGEEIVKYSYVLKKLSLITLTVPLTFLLGQTGLIAFGFDKQYNYSLILVAVFYVATIIGLLLFDIISFDKLIYLRVFSDYLLLLIILYHIFKNKILKLPLLTIKDD